MLNRRRNQQVLADRPITRSQNPHIHSPNQQWTITKQSVDRSIGQSPMSTTKSVYHPRMPPPRRKLKALVVVGLSLIVTIVTLPYFDALGFIVRAADLEGSAA